MADSREILLKLVRLAMGWECDYSLPEEINWQEVLDMAYEQGVSAIILDGYEVYLQKNPAVRSFLGRPENKPLKVAILGQLTNIENTFQNHLSALSVLSRILSEKRIPFLILKGFSCARYYPVPNHRGCGDIDIYPGQLFLESSQVLTSSGVEVDPHYYRHSVCMINDVLIENHRILSDLRGPRRQTRALEKLLEQEAKKSILDGRKVKILDAEIPGAILPSANFNALFLPWHVSAHFEFEKVTIRHLLDWALFLVNEGKEIDVSLFRRAKQDFTFGYSKFTEILTCLSLKYLKMPVGDIPLPIIEDAAHLDMRIAERVFDYMFVGQKRKRGTSVWRSRINNLFRIWDERWKYHEVYDMSFLSFLFYKVVGVLFKVGEDD